MIERTRPPVVRLISAPARVSHCDAMNFSSASGEILKVPGSISTNTGRAPTRAIVPAVAKKVYGLVKTSSPAPMSSAIRAISRASVPDEMPMPNLQPEYAAVAASSVFTSGPRMKYCDSLTRSSAASSSRLSARYWGLRSSSGTFIPRTLPQVGHARWLRRLGLVVLEIPIDEAPDAGLHRRRRLVADVAHQVFDIRKGIRHIAGLQGQHVLHGFAAEALIQDFDVADQVHRSVIADVV